MFEVPIPLKRVGEREVGSPEDYYKVIQDEFSTRYLELLGIAATRENKAVVKSCRALDDCTIQGVWPESHTGSSVADALKIVPPLRRRIDDYGDAGKVDKAFTEYWYGQAEPIPVKPPDVMARLRGFDSVRGYVDEAAAGGGQQPELVAEQVGGNFADTLTELLAELKGMKKEGAAGTMGGGRGALGGGAHGIGAAKPKLLAERLDSYKHELEGLKAKFILPFACERPPKDGERETQLVPWPTEGPLDIEVSELIMAEASQMIGVSLADVRKDLKVWVDETMPLEMLTSRTDESDMEDVRRQLRNPNVGKLAGLLAHLLYWLALAPGVEKAQAQRRDGIAEQPNPQLTETALQSMSIEAHRLWGSFETGSRDSAFGVSVTLPCLMLTLKSGIERIFQLQYPSMMGDAVLHQTVLDRINSMMMRFFDPDGMYARFGKFDGSGKAIALTRRLDRALSQKGHTSVKRLCGQAHRSTPLVRSVLGSGASSTDRAPSSIVCDARTRAMLYHSDLKGNVPMVGVVRPPEDQKRQKMLLQAAMQRLARETGTTKRMTSAMGGGSTEVSPRRRNTFTVEPRKSLAESRRLGKVGVGVKVLGQVPPAPLTAR